MFKATSKLTSGLSGLTYYVDLLNMPVILAVFPEGQIDGWYDYDNGYDEDSVGFVDDQGNEFCVYARWGNVRIGTVDNNVDGAEKLARHLYGACLKSE